LLVGQGHGEVVVVVVVTEEVESLDVEAVVLRVVDLIEVEVLADELEELLLRKTV